MTALRELRELQHLVVSDVEPASSPAEVEDRDGSGAPAGGEAAAISAMGSWFGFLTAPLFGSSAHHQTPDGRRKRGLEGATSKSQSQPDVACSHQPLPPVRRCLSELPDALSLSVPSLRHLEWAPSSHDPLSVEELLLIATRAFRCLTALRFLYVHGDGHDGSGISDGGLEGTGGGWAQGGSSIGPAGSSQLSLLREMSASSERGAHISGGGGGGSSSSLFVGVSSPMPARTLRAASEAAVKEAGDRPGVALWRRDLQAALPR